MFMCNHRPPTVIKSEQMLNNAVNVKGDELMQLISRSSSEDVIGVIGATKEVREIILKFLYDYASCFKDRAEVVQKLSGEEVEDGDHQENEQQQSIFDVCDPSDAAIAALFYVDNYKGWEECWNQKKADKDKTYVPPRTNPTKWAKSRGKTRFKDRVSSQAKIFLDTSTAFFEKLWEDGNLKNTMALEGVALWNASGKAQTRKRSSPTQRTNIEAPAPKIPKLGRAYMSLCKEKLVGDQTDTAIRHAPAIQLPPAAVHAV